MHQTRGKCLRVFIAAGVRAERGDLPNGHTRKKLPGKKKRGRLKIKKEKKLGCLNSDFHSRGGSYGSWK